MRHDFTFLSNSFSVLRIDLLEMWPELGDYWFCSLFCFVLGFVLFLVFLVLFLRIFLCSVQEYSQGLLFVAMTLLFPQPRVSKLFWETVS